ncbi:DGQHR domain-containing protein [Thermoguttaceae bacterium LCP21S3_D4]
MSEYFGIKYKQEEQSYISFICPISYVIENSEVLVYGVDPKYGYQRRPRRDHYLKIAKNLQEEHGLVTPNSIILGLNINDLENLFEVETIGKNEHEEIVKLVPKTDDNGIKFRIIDGQHRIEGFREAIKNSSGDEKSKLEGYSANVIVMLLDEKNRLPEVRVFCDINSKAKPIKMDLTYLAEYQYALLERPSEINTSNYFLTTVLKLLNEGTKCVGWMNGIIIEINAQNKVGCVGFKSFLKTIEPLYGYFMKDVTLLEEMSFEEKVQILNERAEVVYEELSRCWNLVFDKWDLLEERWISANEENYQIYYNNDYYLQKTMGVVAVNKIIVNCYLNGDGYGTFVDIISKSALTVDDWRTNGKFAGLNSMSGANQIEKTIREYVK